MGGETCAGLLKEAVDEIELGVWSLGLEGVLDEFDAEFFEVVALELGEQFFFNEEGVFGPEKIEPFVVKDMALRAFEPDEAAKQGFDAFGDELELLPEAVDFRAFGIGDDFFDQRLVVSEEAFDEMEAGGEAAVGVDEGEAVGESEAESLSGSGDVFCRLAFLANEQLGACVAEDVVLFAEGCGDGDDPFGAGFCIQLAIEEHLFLAQVGDRFWCEGNLEECGGSDDEGIWAEGFTRGV